MKILSNEVMNARQFVMYYTGLYFYNCDTHSEAMGCLRSAGIFLSDGETFENIDKMNDCVIVQFSKEDDYTDYEYRAMPIQKRYKNRFLNNMKKDEGEC